MNKYEAMFIIKPDLSEEEKKTLLAYISDTIDKNNGKVSKADVWLEKRKLQSLIKKYWEGQYFLVNFSVLPEAVTKIKYAYKLNENIFRVLITKVT